MLIISGHDPRRPPWPAYRVYTRTHHAHTKFVDMSENPEVFYTTVQLGVPQPKACLLVYSNRMHKLIGGLHSLRRSL